MGLFDRFKRKPLITDDVYGRLMTSFGRVVDRDPMVKQPAEALAIRVVREEQDLTILVDLHEYAGAAEYHLRLLAGAWIMAQEGSIPRQTAEVFTEALIWKFPREAKRLPERLTELATGQFERDDTINL
jgi:hypothetical protein